VKTRADAEAAEYEAEAAALAWLGEGPVPIPEVLAVGAEPAFLALRWVEPGALTAAGAEELGRGLAAMHALGAPAHGWIPGAGDGLQRIGSLGLEAGPGESWSEVYASQRLLPLARICRERGAITAAGADAVAAVCERIERLAGPPEPPARLHGDLWAGNVHADERGTAWLIDPSAHGGHREMDLAMLRLFGPPGGAAGGRVFDAYEEAAPLADGAAERVDLWQLQPLLVHAALFGGSYGGSAERAARSLL
jgi:fructosamine-3-kinase